MITTFDRRQLLRLALVVAGLLVGTHHTAKADEHETDTISKEIYLWKPTGDTRCNAGRIEERWGYYECVGGSCTPLYFEWRPTDRPCLR